jgi:hypothetical protein
VANVSERKRWTYDPFPAGDATTINDLARKLGEELGGDWHGYFLDVAVPDAALVVRFSEGASGRRVLSGVLVLGDAITADQLRKVPVDALENSVNLGAENADAKKDADLAKLRPLVRTADMSPEDFSRLVAEHFKVWARYVPHPAAAMAAEWKVKAPTVHTWIREARLRGFLPAARRGKAG